MSDILSNISKHISLTKEEQEHFLSLLTPVALQRKQLLLKSGEPCTTFNYVTKGALRAFFTDSDDKEVTIMFAMSDWWITDMPSFVSQQAAMISIEAIEHSSILQITHQDLNNLYLHIPKFERFMRILMQNAYVREQIRILHTLSLPAEERYVNFISKYPGIAKQLTNKNIASYLGVTPEFLSVVRNRLSKKK